MCGTLLAVLPYPVAALYRAAKVGSAAAPELRVTRPGRDLGWRLARLSRRLYRRPIGSLAAGSVPVQLVHRWARLQPPAQASCSAARMPAVARRGEAEMPYSGETGGGNCGNVSPCRFYDSVACDSLTRD